MKKTVLLLLLSFQLQSFGQGIATNWQYTDPVKSDYYDVIETPDGGYLCSGAQYNIDTSNNMASILKLDANGNLVWITPYYTAPDCGPHNSWGRAATRIRESNDGNYYFCLNYLDDNWPLTSCDARFIKFSPTGESLGEIIVPGAGFVRDFIITDNNDFVFISSERLAWGRTKLCKIDSSGNYLWSVVPEINTKFSKIIETTDGNYALIGIHQESIDADYDSAIFKVDYNGNTLASMQFNFIGDSVDGVTDIKQTPDGGFIVLGIRLSTFPANPPSVALITSRNYWFSKLSNALVVEWEKFYGGSREDYGYSIALTNDGGYVATGSSTSWDYDALWPGGVYWYEHTWTMKSNQSGSLMWQTPFSTYEHCRGKKIIATSDLGYVVLGSMEFSGSGGTKGIIFKFYDPDLATNEFTGTNELQVYPNPAASILNLRFSNQTIIDQVKITNSLGKVILQQTSNTNQIQTQNFATGFYFLEATANGKTYRTKFIKQ